MVASLETEDLVVQHSPGVTLHNSPLSFDTRHQQHRTPRARIPSGSTRLCCCFFGATVCSMSRQLTSMEVDGVGASAARRKRERRLGSFWKHEQFAIKMATAGAAHHSWQSRASVGVQTAPAPVVEYFAPAPAAPFAPAPGVHTEPAPVDEYVASAPMFEDVAPAPLPVPIVKVVQVPQVQVMEKIVEIPDVQMDQST